MTSPSDPSELASALADGLLSGEEAARAAAAPAVAARLEEIHRLRSALRYVPPAPELPKSRALAAAVEAGVDAHDEPAGSPGNGTWKPWLAAAAILAVVVLGVGLFALRDPGDGDVTTSSEMADPDSSAEGEESAGAQEDSSTALDAESPRPADDRAETGGPVGGDGEALLAEVDLGAVADEDELASAVAGASRSGRAVEPGSAPEAPQDQSESAGDSPEQAGQCPQLTAAGDPERGRSTLFATATMAGERVWVHLYPDGSREGTAQLVATSSECVDVVDRIVQTEP